MELPEVIYIPENLSNSDKSRLSSPDEKNRGIEYISKVSLIRWAIEKKAELLDGEPTDVAAGINIGMDMLIYKLEKQ